MISRRTFLADTGMGFTGLALGAMLPRESIDRLRRVLADLYPPDHERSAVADRAKRDDEGVRHNDLSGVGRLEVGGERSGADPLQQIAFNAVRTGRIAEAGRQGERQHGEQNGTSSRHGSRSSGNG